MAPVDLSETPPSSPTCSPPRKKAKFSLRLKGKSKPKVEDEFSDQNDTDTQKKGSFYPIFRSPGKDTDKGSEMEIEPSPPEFALAGLLNKGNICYANAVLQVLRRCPGFERFVTQLAKDIKMLEDSGVDNKNINLETKDLVTHLDKLLSQMFAYEVDFLSEKEDCNHLRYRGRNLVLAANPHDFMASFRETYSSFECDLQHDAQEFLCSLIMALQESTDEIKKHYEKIPLCPSSNGNTSSKEGQKSECQKDTFLKNLFQGKLVHQTKCLTCEHAKLRYEDIQEISVPVVEDQPYLDARKKLMLSPTPKKNKVNTHTLQWAISQFASSECLQGDNKYFCENCNTYCEARISTCFEELPTVLTVHLKRFTSSIGLSSKITSNLQTPLSFSLQEWCSKKCQLRNSVYELFGIVLHSGITSGSGHYETYIRIPNVEQQKCTSKTEICDNIIPNGNAPNANDSKQSSRGDSVTYSTTNTSSVIDGNIESKANGDVIIINEVQSSNGNQESMTSCRNDKTINSNNETLECDSDSVFKKSSDINTPVNVNSNNEIMDINQNCVSKSHGKAQDDDDSKKTSKRQLRPRKAKKSYSNSLTEDSPKTSDRNNEPIQKDDDQCIDNSKSPFKSQEKSSCMSLITKYFHRSKRLPSNNKSKHGKPENETDEKGTTNNKSDENSAKSSKCVENSKPLQHKMVNRSIEDSFKRVKSSKLPTIRKLNFVSSSTENKENSESDSQEHEDTAKLTCNMNSKPEWLTKDWIHFDDCSVESVIQKDIIDVLAASTSSFMSPYLLFYQKSDIIL